MAVLSPIPTSVIPSSLSAAITLDKAALVTAHLSGDAYWSATAYWERVMFHYTDALGIQNEYLTFYGSSTAAFNWSSIAKINNWQCKSITVYNFDGGSKTVLRAAFGTATAYDFG
jgi:hypothetical protein